jgi:type II secretion system protein D
MRPRIHGWIISLVLVGAAGLVLGVVVRGRPSSANRSILIHPEELAALVAAHSRALIDSPAGLKQSAPSVADSQATVSAPELFDVEGFSALVKKREQRESDAQFSSTAAAQSDTQHHAHPQPAAPDNRLSDAASVIQTVFEVSEPAQSPPQESATNSVEQKSPEQKPVEQESATQVDRLAFNSIPPQSGREILREQVQVPEQVWAVLGPRGGFRPQDVRLVQQEPGQVQANIGQVDVQALDQLGVVILRGSPQDVEAMKKIIEEIQRISEGVEPYIRVFQLNRAPATQVRDKLQELYSGTTSSTSSTQRTTTGQPTTTQTTQPSTTSTSVVQTPALRRFQIAADDRSNTLIVLASPQMMEELARVIERLDADAAPAVSEIRVFPLKNAEAQEIANILTQAISGQAAGATGETIGGATATVAGGGEVRIAKRTATLKFFPIEGRPVESGILDEVRITAVIRTNSVVVSAPASSMQLMASIINELDKPPAIVASMKVIELKYADATNMRTTLAELFDLEPTTGTGLAGGQGALGNGLNQLFQRPMAVAAGDSPPVSLRVAVDERTNSLIVSGPDNALLQVQAVIRTLDLSDIHNRKSSVYRLKNSYALDVATTLTNFFTNKRTIEGQAAGLTTATGTIVGPFTRLEQDVVVVALDNSMVAQLTTAANVTQTATPPTQGVSNLLLVSASPRNYDQVIQMIEDLDAPQPQVMIQCIIAQLSLTDDFEFGIEFGLQNDVLFDRGNLPFTSTSTLTNTPAGPTTVTNANPGVLPGTPGFPFNSTGPLGNTNLARPAQVGGQGLSTLALGRASLIDGLTNVGGLVLTASSQNVTAMLRALQNDGRLEILSRPQIMTVDGRTARVQVGENFPYIGTVSVTETATMPTVSFASIGVILTVKPNITPDNRIYLEVVPEVSELREIVNVQQIATTTGTLNQQAPRITQTTANTVVSVYDGQTVVLGGLIQKRQNDFVRKIPWLGDLPHIGCLFRFTQQRHSRQELLIIMTPHIVRTEADAQRLKEIELSRVSWVLNQTQDCHDLGLSQGANGSGAENPSLSDPAMGDEGIRQMSGEEPVAGPPADWAQPIKGAKGDSDGKQRTMGERLRRVFRRSES